MKVRLTKIKKTLVFAFGIRIFMLTVIILLGNKLPSLGFIDNSPLYDDYRYEQGGVLYAEKAKKLIDVDTFTQIFDSMDDWTGHNLMNPLSSTPLWYWIVCILIYITKIRWSVRLLNIFISVITIHYVYKTSYLVYGEKAAELSASLIAFLPYPILFSCFSYKDCFVSLCTFYIFYIIVKMKYIHKITTKETIFLFFSVISMFLTRSGLSVVLLSMVVLYYYFDKIRDCFIRKKINYKTLILFICVFMIVIIMLYLFMDVLVYKFMAYNVKDTEYAEALGLGSLIKIYGITEIWKLPMTYLVAVMQPIKFGEKITSWCSLVGSLNLLMSIVAVGSALYIFKRNKKDVYFFIVTFVYYLISVISSILIFRQLYSLLPIPIMYFAEYYTSCCRDNKRVLMWGSILLSTGLLVCFCI